MLPTVTKGPKFTLVTTKETFGKKLLYVKNAFEKIQYLASESKVKCHFFNL